MLKQLVGEVRKLKEYDAFGVLLQPRVLANMWRYQREFRELPLVMHSCPPAIEIELTNRCNLACVQCLRSLGLKPYQLGDIHIDNFRKILLQFPALTGLCLNGFGEPLLHPDFFKIVDWAHSQMPWMKIFIYSNAMKLDSAMASKMVDCGLTEVNVSIDAARPETYKRVRRGGSLDVVHGNIRGLLRAKRLANGRFPLVNLNFVMLNQNEGELVTFVEQAHDLGVNYINCISYATYDWGFKNLRSRDSYLRELDAAELRMQQLGVKCRTMPSRDFSWADPKTPFGCRFFWGDSLRITYDGSMTLGCCTPFKETFSYGNLLETPFDILWNNEIFQRNRELARRRQTPVPICASCDQTCKRFFDHGTDDAMAKGA